ncbi:MAG: DUF1015 domain-containing protein [Betaproteobacteria bacterium]|nr:DUF1015 domain-containing protein [Betaproteobacteria bacterium]
MHLIRPFAGLRPASGRAAEVIAPPYDVLSTEEARARAAGRPWSFLHISKPEIDLPAGTDPHAPEVYARAAENLRRMTREDVLASDPAPSYYVYRLVMGAHTQTGLVAAASLADYDTNRIRKHEHTQTDKENDRVRQIDALNAQTGPVIVAYPHAPGIDEILAGCSAGAPDADATADDGVRHSLWVVRDAQIHGRLTRAFDALPALYIADGHHRTAAASRVAAARRKGNPRHTGEESYNYFLAVIFPHHQMQILDYNRVVADLNGMDAGAFLARVGERFSVEKSPKPVKPAKPAELGLYLPGQWYRLALHRERIPASDPLARLDVRLLSDHLLGPVLGIKDLRRDKRIDYVGGIRGLTELEKRVNGGGMAAAFALYPTRMEDLMAVAEAGDVMPTKSTWFEPKLADGLVSHVLD